MVTIVIVVIAIPIISRTVIIMSRLVFRCQGLDLLLRRTLVADRQTAKFEQTLVFTLIHEQNCLAKHILQLKSNLGN